MIAETEVLTSIRRQLRSFRNKAKDDDRLQYMEYLNGTIAFLDRAIITSDGGVPLFSPQYLAKMLGEHNIPLKDSNI